MQVYDNTCLKKKNKKISQTFLSAVFAGIYIAMGALCSQIAQAAGMSKLISSALFPVGLIMVILMDAELFTGNCLLPAGIMSEVLRIHDMFKNWLLVYFGNLLGSLIFAWIVVKCNIHTMFDEALTDTMLVTYSVKLNQPAGVLILKGILCNILVCTAVWMAIHAENMAGKIHAAFIPTFVFVFLGFEHSVANMYFLPVAVMTGNTIETPYILIANQIVTVTIGNIIGGSAVALWQYHIKKQ